MIGVFPCDTNHPTTSTCQAPVEPLPCEETETVEEVEDFPELAYSLELRKQIYQVNEERLARSRHLYSYSQYLLRLKYKLLQDPELKEWVINEFYRL